MRHFIECIKEGIQPITGGPEGLEVVRILEASSISLKQKGASVALSSLNGLNGSKNINGTDNVNGETAAEKPADGKLITA